MADPLPPPEIQAAAARVQAYLDSQTFAAAVKSQAQPGGTAADGRVSDEAYRAMTPAQKLDYARQFDQKQFSKDKRR